MTKTQIKITALIAIIIVLLFSTLFASGIVAQSNQAVITPTLAPSKTPTATPVIATAQPTAESTLQPVPDLPKPFTQADLTVLTGNIQRPNGLAFFDGTLYSSCSGDWTVYAIDVAAGTTAQYIYGVKNAHTMYVTSEDNRPTLWIPDFQSNTLTHIVRGTSQLVASNLKGPWGITPLTDSEFAVTDFLGNDLLSIAATGETKELIQNLRSPAGVAADETHLYVANAGSARRAIEWFNRTDLTNSASPLDSSDSSLNISLVTGLQSVTNLVIAPDGDLYFSYALGTRGVVGRVDPKICMGKGGCSNDEVEIVLYSELAAPLAGLTISTDMRLYVHSIFSPDIYWLQLNANAPADDT